MLRRPTLRQLATGITAGAFVAAFALGGSCLALLAAGGVDAKTSMARLQVGARPALDGEVVVFVPLVDWRVQVLEHRAPVTLVVEVRAIDRAEAEATLRNPREARQSLIELRAQTQQIVRDAVERAVVVALVGGVVGSFLAGGVIGAVRLRRRWLVIAPSAGVILVSTLVAVSAHDLRNVDTRSLQPNAGNSRAEELPQLIRFAEQLLYVGDDYPRHYATALRSVTNVLGYGAAATRPPTQTVFVASDLHSNAFVLPAFDRFVGDHTVFAVGDFGQVGARLEEDLAPQVADLGGELVAVSGNHDSHSLMSALDDAGATVLGSQGRRFGDVDSSSPPVDEPFIRVGDLVVAAYDDPLERRPGAGGQHVLRVYGEAYEQQVEEFLDWYDDLARQPDVLMVHQHGLAHRLVEHLRSSGDRRSRLTIFTGHDHEAHVHDHGNVVVVDGGTLGAGGPFAAGSQPASFARVQFVGTVPVAVDLVAVDPISGTASARRQALAGGRARRPS